MKHITFFLLPLLFFVTVLSSQSILAQNKGITYQVIIKNPAGQAINIPAATVNVKIVAKNGCVLREEEFTGRAIVNGFLNLPVLQGARVGVDPNLPVHRVFDNSSSFSGLTCINADGSVSGLTSYTPIAEDTRKLRISFTDAGNPVVADFNIRSTAFAFQAEKLNGKDATDFVNINNAQSVTQSNVESIFQRYTKLDSILNNFNATGTALGANITGNAATATNFTGSLLGDVTGTQTTTKVEKLQGRDVDAVAPTNNYVLTWDSATSKWTPKISGSAPVTSVAGKTGAVNLVSSDITGLGAAAGMNVGTAAGTVAAGNDARFTDARAPVGAAGGDLSGTYPNPTIAKIQNKAVTLTAIASGDILQYNGTGFVNRNIPTCAANEYLTFNGTNYSCVTDSGSAGTVASVSVTSPLQNTGTATNPIIGLNKATAGQDGYLSSADYTLFASKLSNFSSLSSADVVGALTYTPLAPATQFSGDVTGTYTTTSVTKIRGVPVDVAAATPISGDVLRYDGTKYIATALPSAPVASVAGKTGVVTLTSADITGLGAAAGMNVGTAAGTVAAGNDARFTDARAPSGAASGDLSGTYPNPTIAKIQSYPILLSSPTSGDFLKYNGSNWVNATPAISDIANLTTQLSNKLDQSNMPGNCGAGQTLTFSSPTGTWACTTIAITSTQVSGLGGLATANSVDLSTAQVTGTLAPARMPALTGDVTSTAGGTATTIANNAVTAAKMANGTITDAQISATAAIAWGKIDKTGAAASDIGASPTAGSASITTIGTITTGTWNGSTIPVAYGGTGTATGSITGTTALTFTAGGTNTNVNLVPNGTGTVDVASKRITSLAAPTAATDAATKAYVDASGSFTGAVNIASTPYTIQTTDSGKAFYYTNNANGIVNLPALSAVSDGFRITIQRQVAKSLTLTSNGTDKFPGGISTLEMQGKNLQSVTLMKLGTLWSLINQTEECTVGQECWTANGTGGMKQIYVGSYKGRQYFTTPGGCTDSATPTCAGGTDTVAKAWATAAPESNTMLNLTNDTDGQSQSATLAGYATAQAAQYCENMNYAGYTDWYLPARQELNFLYQNSANIGGFLYSSIYWSSTEYITNNAWSFYFNHGFINYDSKTDINYVRCMRRF